MAEEHQDRQFDGSCFQDEEGGGGGFLVKHGGVEEKSQIELFHIHGEDEARAGRRRDHRDM